MPTPGYADLDTLVRRHPGWVGMARYDEALARLDEAARRTPDGMPTDTSLVTLPAAAAPPPSPALAVAGERQRLEVVQQAQVARLRERQEQSRQRQIALDRLVWERQAAAEYARTVETVQADYTRRLSLLAMDRDAQRLNLTLQIRALEKIVKGWDRSTPPTPALNQARADLKRKQAQLATLDITRRQSEAQARADREAAVAAAAQTRETSVSTLVASERTRLSAQDETAAAALRDRLSEQIQSLLHQEQSLSVPPAPPVGGLGQQGLPPGPAMALISPGAAHSLRASRAHLEDQRARWLAFLYSDTRAAVQDAAQQQHWRVTFGHPVPGERDLTAPLALALTSRVWKS